MSSFHSLILVIGFLSSSEHRVINYIVSFYSQADSTCTQKLNGKCSSPIDPTLLLALTNFVNPGKLVIKYIYCIFIGWNTSQHVT